MDRLNWTAYKGDTMYRTHSDTTIQVMQVLLNLPHSIGSF